MPTDDMSEMSNSLPAPPVQPVFVSVTFRRGKGQCLMVIDATGLHNYLARIGVTERDGRFLDGPAGSSTIISGTTVHAGALLRTGGPQEFNLLDHFTNCPSGEVMRDLSASVDATVHKIVDHYRPIEISVIIHSKPGMKA
jgi:hypothetical protein